MERKEFVNKVFETLEEAHPNLYHSIVRAEFQNYKNAFIEKCESLSELQFDKGMRELFALFKDGHTNYSVNSKGFCQMRVYPQKGKFYIRNSHGFDELKAVNGIDIKIIASRLKKICSFETKEDLSQQISNKLSSITFLAMIGIVNEDDRQITIQTQKAGEQVIQVKPVSQNPTKTNKNQYRNYSFSLHKNPRNDLTVLMVRYTRCREHEDFTMLDFIQQIKKSCIHSPKTCLIDVRNNIGGSDVVIKPLLYFLKENKIKTFVLTNQGTFSAGRWAVRDAKELLHSEILGTATGGSTYCFGNRKDFNINGKTFSCSNKHMDMTKIFGYKGAILPDIYIPENMEGTSPYMQLDLAFAHINEDYAKTNNKPNILPTKWERISQERCQY